MPPSFSQHTLLQVIPKLISGGAERTTLEVSKAFIAAGGRSLVVSSGGEMVEELVSDGAEHISLAAESKNPLLIAHNAGELRKLIEEHGVSLVHARSRAPAWSALMAARRTGRPFVTTYHGTYSAKTSLKRLYNSVMVRGDAVIANSQFTADNVRAQYQGRPYFTAEKMVTIPRGADLSRFDPEGITQDRVDRFSGLFGQGLRVVLPGRFTPWKGQEVLIRAATLLKEQEPDLQVQFIAVGRMDEKPDYVDGLRRQIDEAGLNDRFQLLPASDDVPALLQAADVVVSASTDPEAFGRVAVEAQAAGRPIIATAHGGSLETVVEGETGFMVPPRDAQALASAILRVHHLSAVGREEIGRRGMAHAREKFTTEAMTSATLMVYHELLSRTGE